ncbi:F-box/kelch-repeat protein [Capsicum galapagoense]
MNDEIAKLGNCSLSGDEIVEILLRLPVKALLRFQTVSKSWHSFITSRDFIQLHRQQPVHEKLLRISDRGRRDIPTISFFTLAPRLADFEIDRIVDVDLAELESLSVVVDAVDLPFPCSADDEVRVVGSCNGILCVHFNRSSSIVLWNPATRKYRFLELPDYVSFYSDPFFPYVMFGYVPEKDDYNVVKVSSCRRKDERDTKVWVYTMSSDTWEEMDGDFLCGLVPKGGSAVSVNGCLYWMSCSDDDGLNVITCFDLCKRVFGRVKLPNHDIVTKFTMVKLMVLKDCLSMIIDYGNGVDVDHYEVWVMNERQGEAESWTKQFDFLPFSTLAQPVGSWRDVELLFANPGGLSPELVSYNAFTEEIYCFRRRSLMGRFKVINYVESLESVEGR